ncbi:MAG: FtsX-like permease family protein [candidate division Zixibacteria bacterium]|nr:FtsX-like permease family protein [candidate division Zixibacteria bacterium]
MTFRDYISVSTGNLWRMKLRATLTVAGVVIAIAAFIAIMSYGVGLQQNITEQYENLGLVNTMMVYPPRDQQKVDTANIVINQEMVDSITALPGVRLVYPFNEFNVTITTADTSITTKAQALSVTALQTKAFSDLAAGETFGNDSAKYILATEALLHDLAIESADSLIGDTLIVSIDVASLDSAIARVPQTMLENIHDRAANIRMDSLRNRDYLMHLVHAELKVAMTGFMDGLMNARKTVSDTLVVSGVLRGRFGGPLRLKPIIIPIATGRNFASAGYSGDPVNMLGAMYDGSIFEAPSDSSRTFPKLTLELDPHHAYEPIRDTIEALGFRTFSFAEQLKEIRRFFIYFDLGLAVVGMIALVTAALGIVNTMVMSIVERTREIGVLKSLGAGERDIRILFLVESGLIGIIGAIIGIIGGWMISRVASIIARTIMEREGIPPMELFALPLWLIATALGFALAVSLIAGYYPASRAARIDPVNALRGE